MRKLPLILLAAFELATVVPAYAVMSPNDCNLSNSPFSLQTMQSDINYLFNKLPVIPKDIFDKINANFLNPPKNNSGADLTPQDLKKIGEDLALQKNSYYSNYIARYNYRLLSKTINEIENNKDKKQQIISSFELFEEAIDFESAFTSWFDSNKGVIPVQNNEEEYIQVISGGLKFSALTLGKCNLFKIVHD